MRAANTPKPLPKPVRAIDRISVALEGIGLSVPTDGITSWLEFARSR